MRLQYNISENDKYSMAELAQMGIEGGCGWINIIPGKMTDDDLRAALVPDVVELCRENGVILTIDDSIELAREFGLHGVRVHAGPATPSPAELREELGPEAIIGYVSPDPTAIPSMMAADVDFVATPAHFSAGQRTDFVMAAQKAGYELPIVADGEFTPQAARALYDEGFSAISVGLSISEAPDPVVATQSYEV